MVTRSELPEWVINKPELKPFLNFYFDSFLLLDSERSHAMGVTAIPVTSMIKFAQFHSLDKEETTDFIYLIKGMDRDNMEKIEEKLKKVKT